MLQPKRSARLWRWAAGGVAAGALIGLVAALTYQETYTSRATVRVVPSQVPERFFPAGSALDVVAFGREAVHMALSRQTLKTVVQSYDLYPSERLRMPMEDVLDLLVSHVETKVAETITVAFTYPDPKLAQRVTRHLMAALADDVIRERFARAKMTVEFLHAESVQAARSWEDLIAQAAKVSGPAAERLALDREVAAHQYRIFRERLAEAESVVRLDDRKQGPTMEVVELPNLPEEPDFNRWILLAAGAGGGLLLGLLAGVARRFQENLQLRRAIIASTRAS